MTIKAKMMKVTPKKAEEWLEKNTGNRNVSSTMVDRYAADMVSGRWQSNGEPVIFNGSALLDGQHRLKAVVKAGIPVDMLVVTGVERDAFRTIDSGRARTFGHVLSSQGYSYANQTAGAVALLVAYETSSAPFNLHGRTTTKGEMEATLEKNKGVLESVEYVSSYLNPFFSQSLMAFVHYLAAKKDRAAADQFIKDVATGDGVRATSPAGLVRQRMIEQKTSAAGRARKLDKRVVIFFLLRCWNALRSGERLARLQVPRGDDPRGLSIDLPALV